MTLTTTRCDVATTHGSRYLQQLAKHWAHKFEVSYDAQQARIGMPDDRVIELTAGADMLAIRLTAPTDAMAHLQKVTDSHIARFAFREELIFDWQAA
ncbi:DUF2218 domain-containing protein [Paracoccus laeviglucosivorans]|uniref:DUF2218 domain-containing protein n=1 Tax=Paracoccus laeviglucosivorans TaxID=1197861 RepID=A0A521CBZ1_9RHOB|nr:DUF2218 domain-containing protein [Paracoccus laeviglucosivorans]SMO56949.1 hypothetical protein SAMN06265221_104164 [Paracoccus laeviglucosivorans]